MKVEFSKAFIKASKRLSGKMLDSLRHMIAEVKEGKAWLGIKDPPAGEGQVGQKKSLLG